MYTTTEFFNQQPALNYIRNKGYASYSSLKNYRDAEVPTISNEAYFAFGKELHSRFLEGIKLLTLTVKEEALLKAMIKSLNSDLIVKSIMRNTLREQKFEEKLYGISVLGYIDILGKSHVGDLKSTYLTNGKKFIEAMDFLQAAFYLAITGFVDFYYIGISKQYPHTPMVYNVKDYPNRINAAHKELKQLLTEIKWLL